MAGSRPSHGRCSRSGTSSASGLPLRTGGQISPSTPQTCARVDGARDPKRFLEPGGRLVSHVAGIGELHNRLVAGSSYRPPA